MPFGASSSSLDQLVEFFNGAAQKLEHLPQELSQLQTSFPVKPRMIIELGEDLFLGNNSSQQQSQSQNIQSTQNQDQDTDDQNSVVNGANNKTQLDIIGQNVASSSTQYVFSNNGY